MIADHSTDNGEVPIGRIAHDEKPGSGRRVLRQNNDRHRTAPAAGTLNRLRQFEQRQIALRIAVHRDHPNRIRLPRLEAYVDDQCAIIVVGGNDVVVGQDEAVADQETRSSANLLLVIEHRPYRLNVRHAHVVARVYIHAGT